MTKLPTYSPWGKIETINLIAPGVAFATTPSHEGYWLAPDRLTKVPETWRLRRFGAQGTLESAWFEGDRDWCLVFFAFPHLFPVEARSHAQITFDRWVARAA